MSRPWCHEDGTSKEPNEWTLAEYLAVRDEFDGMNAHAELRKRGKIAPGFTVLQLMSAWVEAQWLIEKYLR